MSSKSSRVTAIISFYDEQVEQLAACVSSLANVVDHVVAVDGAYMLYPNARPSSDPAQMRTIVEVCRGLRIGVTTHTPLTVWAGNEVEKRNHCVQLAEAVTSPDGWYFIHDSDCVVTHIAGDWFEQLDKIRDDNWGVIAPGVREVRQIPGYDLDPTEGFTPVRLMYRAIPGLRYGPSHWTIHVPDGEGDDICFWGVARRNPVDAYDASKLIRIEHRKDRLEYRDISARQYYATRDRLGIERETVLHTRKLDGTWGPRRL